VPIIAGSDAKVGDRRRSNHGDLARRDAVVGVFSEWLLPLAGNAGGPAPVVRQRLALPQAYVHGSVSAYNPGVIRTYNRQLVETAARAEFAVSATKLRPHPAVSRKAGRRRAFAVLVK
jgi:hypothetical protein